MSAYIHHAVDRGGAAQHAAARMVQPAAVEVGLAIRNIGPIEPIVGKQAPYAGRHVDGPVAVLWSRLQQQDAHLPILGQARRQYASGRSGADDDVVEGIHRRGCTARWTSVWK